MKTVIRTLGRDILETLVSRSGQDEERPETDPLEHFAKVRADQEYRIALLSFRKTRHPRYLLQVLAVWARIHPEVLPEEVEAAIPEALAQLKLAFGEGAAQEEQELAQLAAQYGLALPQPHGEQIGRAMESSTLATHNAIVEAMNEGIPPESAMRETAAALGIELPALKKRYQRRYDRLHGIVRSRARKKQPR